MIILSEFPSLRVQRLLLDTSVEIDESHVASRID